MRIECLLNQEEDVTISVKMEGLLVDKSPERESEKDESVKSENVSKSKKKLKVPQMTDSERIEKLKQLDRLKQLKVHIRSVFRKNMEESKVLNCVHETFLKNVTKMQENLK